MLTRRHFLATTGAASVYFAGMPMRGYAQTRDLGKIAVIILEGGLDGLSAVPPLGDSSLMKQRKTLVASAPLKLNPFFGLHPNLVNFAHMLNAGEAAIVHATNIPYTQRSHIEGQNLMQSGGHMPYGSDTGWLGRAMEIAGIPVKALALDMPLLIRGGEDLDNLYPVDMPGVLPPSGEIVGLISASYGGDMAQAYDKVRMKILNNSLASRRRDPAGLAYSAGQEMAKPGGPNVSVIRIPDFDTHARQGVDQGMLPRLLTTVDDVFRAYKIGLGDAWENSIVLTLTEFGRTVKENGSDGTDHGYGTAGLLAGGLLKKATVMANWPGLSDKELFEGRDLMATLDYRAVAAAAIEAAFGIPHDQVAEQVFGETKLLRVHDLLFA
jgi:uncharacterized protein (DUF1501 family)